MSLSILDHSAVHLHGSANIASSPAFGGSIAANSEIVVFFMLCNVGGAIPNVTSITDGVGLTWTRRTKHQFTDSGGNGISLEEWWAQAPSGFGSGNGIAGNFDQICDVVMEYAAVGGLGNLALPWDTNVSLPAAAHNASTTVASTPTVSGVSTTAVNTLVFAAIGSSQPGGSNPVAPTGFTSLEFQNTFNASLTISYKLLTGTLSSQTYTGGSSEKAWPMLIDVMAGVAPRPRKYAMIVG